MVGWFSGADGGIREDVPIDGSWKELLLPRADDYLFRTEIEEVINSRPLTFFCTSDRSEPPVKTPSHLVRNRRLSVLPSHDNTLVPLPRVEILKLWAHRQRLLPHFGDRW